MTKQSFMEKESAQIQIASSPDQSGSNDRDAFLCHDLFFAVHLFVDKFTDLFQLVHGQGIERAGDVDDFTFGSSEPVQGMVFVILIVGCPFHDIVGRTTQQQANPFQRFQPDAAHLISSHPGRQVGTESGMDHISVRTFHPPGFKHTVEIVL